MGSLCARLQDRFHRCGCFRHDSLPRRRTHTLACQVTPRQRRNVPEPLRRRAAQTPVGPPGPSRQNGRGSRAAVRRLARPNFGPPCSSRTTRRLLRARARGPRTGGHRRSGDVFSEPASNSRRRGRQRSRLVGLRRCVAPGLAERSMDERFPSSVRIWGSKPFWSDAESTTFACDSIRDLALGWRGALP